MTRHSSSGHIGPFRRFAFRWLFGFDVATLLQQARETSVEAAKPILDWIAGAEHHLAALQAEFERLSQHTLAGSAPAPDHEDRRAAESRNFQSLVESHDATLEWILGTEKHLAGLQAEVDRLGSLARQQRDQTARLIARMALLSERLNDLERADTAIAAAIARDRIANLE